MGYKCEECECWTEDYIHEAWHRLHLWNKGVRQDARNKGMAEFEKRITAQEKRQAKKERAWKPLL